MMVSRKLEIQSGAIQINDVILDSMTMDRYLFMINCNKKKKPSHPVISPPSLGCESVLFREGDLVTVNVSEFC